MNHHHHHHHHHHQQQQHQHQHHHQHHHHHHHHDHDHDHDHHHHHHHDHDHHHDHHHHHHHPDPDPHPPHPTLGIHTVVTVYIVYIFEPSSCYSSTIISVPQRRQGNRRFNAFWSRPQLTATPTVLHAHALLTLNGT